MAPGPWVRSVADLLRRPGARRRDRVDAPLAELSVTGSRVPPKRPVRLDATLTSVSEASLLATGEVAAEWEGDCVRCLKPVRGEVRVPFHELFTRDHVESETYLLRGDEIDLEPLVREHVVLDLPQLPLCLDDCAGLCPHCGADLNLGPCSCEPDERDPRWAALDALRQQGEGAT